MKMDVSQQISKYLKKARVGIAGVGGLGSNAAVALARVGVGTLIIADFDVIEIGNLNRQYYFFHQVGLPKVMALKENIHQIDAQIRVVSHHVKLNQQNSVLIFRDCDVLIEALDNAQMKQMFIETALSEWPYRPLIVGSGLAGWGKNEIIKVQQYDNLTICGDEMFEVSDSLPPLAPRVAVVANLQANAALEFLLKDFKFKNE